MAKDIQDRIADWDLRLAKRKETLTAPVHRDGDGAGLAEEPVHLAGRRRSTRCRQS